MKFKYPLSLIAAFVFLTSVAALIGYFQPVVVFGILLVAGIVASFIRIANFITDGE